MDESFMPNLTKAILAKTSGSPCARLKEVACDFVDGALDADHRALAAAHLEHCPGCTALVAALREANAVLPRMAEVDPGPWFAQRVMRATIYAPRRADLRTLWWKLMHRPRIALEAAYLGAAASMLGLVLPMPTLLGSAAKAPIVAALSSKRLVEPLRSSAQRVAGPVIQAEKRTVASLQQALPPSAWHRGMTKLRAGWRALWKGENKSTPAANP